MAPSFVSVKEELLFNKRSRRTRQYQKSNEIWQLSIQSYVLLLLFSDKCTQDEFQIKIFCLLMIGGRQADVP